MADDNDRKKLQKAAKNRITPNKSTVYYKPGATDNRITKTTTNYKGPFKGSSQEIKVTSPNPGGPVVDRRISNYSGPNATGKKEGEAHTNWKQHTTTPKANYPHWTKRTKPTGNRK